MRRDFLVSAFGIGFGQLIILLATPFLARIYTPEAFGQYATLVALSSVITTAVCLRFEVALPSLQDEEFVLVGRLAFVLPILVAPGICFVLPIESLINVPFFKGIDMVSLRDLALISCFQGMTAVAAACATRLGNFANNAALRILQPATFVGAALLWRTAGLPYALILSWLATVGLSVFVFRRMDWSGSWRKTLHVCAKNWQYPVISLPVAILDTLTLALPLLFIVSAYGEANAGSYSQIQRLVAAPLLLAGIAISQVFYKYAGDLHRQNKSAVSLLRRTVMKLALVGGVLVLLATVVGHLVLNLVLGNSWRTDTSFILLVLLPVTFRMTVSPVTSIFLITDRLSVGASWQVGYFIWTVAILSFSIQRYALDDFLEIFVVSEFVMYTLYLFLADRSARIPRFKASEI